MTTTAHHSALPEFPRGRARAPLAHIVGTPRAQAPRTPESRGPRWGMPELWEVAKSARTATTAVAKYVVYVPEAMAFVRGLVMNALASIVERIHDHNAHRERRATLASWESAPKKGRKKASAAPAPVVVADPIPLTTAEVVRRFWEDVAQGGVDLAGLDRVFWQERTTLARPDRLEDERVFRNFIETWIDSVSRGTSGWIPATLGRCRVEFDGAHIGAEFRLVEGLYGDNEDWVEVPAKEHSREVREALLRSKADPSTLVVDAGMRHDKDEDQIVWAIDCRCRWQINTPVVIERTIGRRIVERMAREAIADPRNDPNR